jgi:hypothetical protein
MIGPCKILRKLSTNSYEIELPVGIEISLIFNVVDQYHYIEYAIDKTTSELDKGIDRIIQWMKKLPTTKTF